ALSSVTVGDVDFSNLLPTDKANLMLHVINAEVNKIYGSKATEFKTAIGSNISNWDDGTVANVNS
ncbi:MAG: hypothetical protein LBD63_00990, partial [Mycoplasmataceae bacterium]|nr:hypothetical protein [Mycoplasmataceae bacterium]